jgi:glycerophosphoryl diester phosphodiesterase
MHVHAVFLFFCATAPQDPVRSDWTIRGNIPADKVVIQAHGGAGMLAPMNTLEAFDLAWTLGTVPEADLQTTQDGVIVAFHDGNLARAVKDASPELKKKRVADLPWAELSALDVGEGLHVTALTPVFERMKNRPERRLYLDIKNVDLKKLSDLVRAHDVESQVILASRYYPDLRKWRALAPASGTLLWMGGTEDDLKRRFEELRGTAFADLTQLQVHVRLKPGADLAKADPFTISDAFLRDAGKELRARNILYQSLPWGGSQAKVYTRLLDLGVMSFATDYPKAALEAVRQYLGM